MEEIKEHDVRIMRYGCSGLWVRYSCYTCDETIDTGQRLPKKEEWEKQKENFLKKHPCSSIKDETRFKTAD